MIELYQCAFSHFCEKVRWALDYKRIPYLHHNLLPGAHRDVARRLAPKSCLPILVDDGTVIQESAVIVSFLDQKYPDHPLTPTNPDQARDALEWEQLLDREIGLTLRPVAEACSVLPEPLSAIRARHRTRRYFQWVGETYQKHRQPAH